jgi:hypothetical protein
MRKSLSIDPRPAKTNRSESPFFTTQNHFVAKPSLMPAHAGRVHPLHFNLHRNGLARSIRTAIPAFA